jgi:hypothetical protein
VTGAVVRLLRRCNSSALAFDRNPATPGGQNGIVYLTGAVQRPSGTSFHFATLPRALCPAHNLWLPIFTAPGVIGSLEIAHNGQMFAFGVDAHNYSGLAGISFPVSS